MMVRWKGKAQWREWKGDDSTMEKACCPSCLPQYVVARCQGMVVEQCVIEVKHTSSSISLIFCITLCTSSSSSSNTKLQCIYDQLMPAWLKFRVCVLCFLHKHDQSDLCMNFPKLAAAAAVCQSRLFLTMMPSFDYHTPNRKLKRPFDERSTIKLPSWGPNSVPNTRDLSD